MSGGQRNFKTRCIELPREEIFRENIKKDDYLHIAVIKTLQQERRIDVYINSRPFTVSNYKDVASNGLRKEERGKKKRKKRLVKHFESISSLYGVRIKREILTSGHHQTMETGTKGETRVLAIKTS